MQHIPIVVLCELQALQAVEALKVSGDKKAAADQIKALYETFVTSDCTMVEVCVASCIHCLAIL